VKALSKQECIERFVAEWGDRKLFDPRPDMYPMLVLAAKQEDGVICFSDDPAGRPWMTCGQFAKVLMFDVEGPIGGGGMCELHYLRWFNESYNEDTIRPTLASAQEAVEGWWKELSNLFTGE